MQLTQTPASRLSSINFDALNFGDVFSDHMLVASYHKDKGWTEGHIKPYGPISFEPSMSALHYGQAVFEGMKAFSYEKGAVNIFRILAHHERFVASCERVNIPAVPKELFVDGLKQLVALDREWVPKERFKSMYIRPFIFATDEWLKMRASDSFNFIIITSPVGNYYTEGIKPVKLITMPEYVRAVKGGVGFAKVPGNYAASLKPAAQAQKSGYTQVLWLDAIEHKYVEEVGTMNIFFLINNVLITPSLGGSILPGVTRRSVIQIAKDWGIPVEERRISIDEIRDAFHAGTLQEAFGTGTAAVISPVGLIHHEGEDITLQKDAMGPFAQRMYDEITGIHHGLVADRHNWCTLV